VVTVTVGVGVVVTTMGCSGTLPFPPPLSKPFIDTEVAPVGASDGAIPENIPCRDITTEFESLVVPEIELPAMPRIRRIMTSGIAAASGIVIILYHSLWYKSSLSLPSLFLAYEELGR
jgi:hypothetical protein